jgi:CHAT domain/TPR repeat
MHSLVILRLNGNLDGDLTPEIGVDMSIQLIGSNVEHTTPAEYRGSLPSNPQLAESLEQWQEKYGGAVSGRITNPSVIIDGTVAEQRRRCQDSAVELQGQFQEWLDSESFRSVRELLLLECKDSNHEVRLLIHSTDRKLLSLPWHLWALFDKLPSLEVALSIANNKRPPRSSQSVKKHFKILAIIGDSTGIDVEVDKKLLKDLANVHPDNILVESSLQTITDHLWEQQWDILFFAGHSRTEGSQGRIFINETDSLTIAQLQHALRKAIERGLKLAIFNSCDGLGLAFDLQQLSIPQVIVMREPVPDQVAHKFLQYFLKFFMSGQSLHLAVRNARDRLQGLEKDWPCASWLPVICQNPATTSLHRSMPGTNAHSSRRKIALISLTAIISVTVIILFFMLRTSRQPQTTKSLEPVCGEQCNASEYIKLGKILHKKNDLKGALAYFQQAVELDSRNPYAHSNRGYLNEDLGDFKAARTDFDRAIDLKADYGYAYKHRGIVRCKQGDKEGAIGDFRKSFEIFKSKGKTLEAVISENLSSNPNSCTP